VRDEARRYTGLASRSIKDRTWNSTTARRHTFNSAVSLPRKAASAPAINDKGGATLFIAFVHVAPSPRHPRTNAFCESYSFFLTEHCVAGMPTLSFFSPKSLHSMRNLSRPVAGLVTRHKSTAMGQRPVCGSLHVRVRASIRPSVDMRDTPPRTRIERQVFFRPSLSQRPSFS